MRYVLFISYTLSLLIFSTALAVEGFQEDFSSLPDPVQAWKQRVFMTYSEEKKQPTGTAFLIHNDGNVAIFLTAGHVILDPQNFVKTFTLRLGQNWSLLAPETPETPSALITLRPLEAGVLDTTSTTWKRAHNAGDVGYIITEASPDLPRIDKALQNFTSLSRFQTANIKSQKHYVLGYPHPAARFRKLTSTQVVQLRWSQGELLHKQNLENHFFIRTDADSLPGNSGGPIVDEMGQLIGIVSGGPQIKSYKPYPIFYTYAAPLESAENLLKTLDRKNQTEVIRSCKGILN